MKNEYISFEIAERIKFVAKQKQKTISAMLESIGLGRNAMANLKTSMPKADNIAKIADYLECSVDYLLGRTESPTINGNNNINQQYIGGNATANINTADSERGDADAQELLKMIKNLSVVQKAEIILKINEMLKFNSKGE